MNITSKLKDNFDSDDLKTLKERLKEIGIIYFSRKIDLFIKENQNVHNISGNNLVSKIGCLITNTSVMNFEDKEVFTKTVYLCEVEFPMGFSLTALKKNMSSFINNSEITPMYAFSNSHIICENGKLFDYGLTLVDLGVSKHSNYGVFNFSPNTKIPNFKEIVYGDNYDPRYYNYHHCKMCKSSDDKDIKCRISEYVDSATKITYNLLGSEKVDNFINNVRRERIYIDKATLRINEFISDMFNRFLFMMFDKIEFVYDSRLANPLNMKKLGTFINFSNIAKDYYIDQLMFDIDTMVTSLVKTLCQDIYLIFNVSDNFVITDIHFFNEDRELRIVKPLYRMYGEAAVDSESIVDSITTDGDIAKMELMDNAYRHGIGCDISSETIMGIANQIDNATRAIEMLVYESKERMDNLIGDRKVKNMLTWEDRG